VFHWVTLNLSLMQLQRGDDLLQSSPDRPVIHQPLQRKCGERRDRAGQLLRIGRVSPVENIAVPQSAAEIRH